MDTARAFINMMLTKGEEDQRGSRQPGVCATVPFKTAPCGRTQLGPSNEILTGEQSGSAEKKIKKSQVRRSLSVCGEFRGDSSSPCSLTSRQLSKGRRTSPSKKKKKACPELIIIIKSTPQSSVKGHDGHTNAKKKRRQKGVLM